MAIPDTLQDAYRAVADYIDEHGKSDRTFEDDKGRVCVIGALRRVFEMNPQAPIFTEPAVLFEINFAKDLSVKLGLPENYGRSSRGSIYNWSDDTSETEIISTLRDLSKDE